jgi:RNA polymerase sigma factor (TIGR02999 family)
MATPLTTPESNQELFAVVYAELRKMAQQAMEQEQAGLTLQPTALVHEAYLRLGQGGNAELLANNRSYFFAAASNAMRQILIESARRKTSLKRGGGNTRVDLTPEEISVPERAEELLVLDEALGRLAVHDAAVAELVTLRYFGGLTIKECAAALGIAPRTADGYWAYAKTWLTREIQKMQE